MQLKRLELIGFKSFAQKTHIEFESGIVAIVGPNGSGKSNITDAIRWILGEQSSGNLRSAKIEDLIFSGTPGRPAMGMAQVSIHLDNSSGALPVDFADVAVSRKVSRDGASEFYLNDSRVLLRDIVDLFARARLGVRGIAVINQGASDVFLQASPAERREMIEEMLGLKEYRIKKRDAENKLKSTIDNLNKGRALLEEIQPHLRSLRRQTTRWNKRQEVEEQLFELEQDHFLRKLVKLDTGSGEIEKKRAMLNDQLKHAQAALEEQRGKLQQTEQHQPEMLEKLNELRGRKDEIERKRGELSRNVGKLEGRLEAAAASAQQRPSVQVSFDIQKAQGFLKELRGRIGDILGMQSLEEVRSALGEVQTQLRELFQEDEKEREERRRQEAEAELESVRGDIEKERAALSEQLAALDQELAVIMKEEQGISSSAQQANKEFQSVYRETENRSNTVKQIERALADLRVEAERVTVQREDFETRLREAGWTMERLEVAKKGFEPQQYDFDVEQKIIRLRRELAAIGEIDESVVEEASETEERNTFLTTQIEDLEKAAEDLTSLIKDLDAKIHEIFFSSLKSINEEFQKFFVLMFGGGRAKLVLDMKRKKKKSALSALGSEIGAEEEEEEEETVSEADAGIDIRVDIPRKKIKSIEMLSGGERSLVSIAALFSLVSVSPPPFLVLDEVDAALDEVNAKRFSNLLRDLSDKTQFIVVTHNRVTMESADALFGVTMGDDGVSKVISLKLEAAEQYAK